LQDTVTDSGDVKQATFDIRKIQLTIALPEGDVRVPVDSGI